MEIPIPRKMIFIVECGPEHSWDFLVMMQSDTELWWYFPTFQGPLATHYMMSGINEQQGASVARSVMEPQHTGTAQGNRALRKIRSQLHKPIKQSDQERFVASETMTGISQLKDQVLVLIFVSRWVDSQDCNSPQGRMVIDVADQWSHTLILFYLIYFFFINCASLQNMYLDILSHRTTTSKSKNRIQLVCMTMNL